MSQAFYRKWRPHTWDEVVSQEHVIQTLRNAVRTGRTGHAYLLAGPRGTGKTTTARLLAKALNCLDDDPAKRPCDTCAHCQAVNQGRFLDLIEIDAASNTSVEDVRDLRDKINFAPTQGRYKVYIIDEVHMLSTAAFNALLKTLEEPPPHAVFILATTEVHKIPATILSRVQRYEFRRIPVPQIVKYLRQMADQEKISVDDEALTLIARQATGAMRDAISLLDQLASTGQQVTLLEAQQVLGTATSAMVIELIEALLATDASKGLKVIQAALDAGTDARQFARQVVDYLRSLLLVRMGNADQVDATADARSQMAQHARAFDGHALLEAIRLFNNAATDARSAWHPGLALEMAFTEAIQGPRPVPVQAAAQSPEAAAPAPKVPAREVALNQAPAPAPSKPAVPEKRQAPAPETRATISENHLPAKKPAAEPQKAAETQPTAAKTAQQAQATTGGGGEITYAEIQQQWNRVRAAVKSKNSLTAAALNSIRTFSLKDRTLILGFQTEVVKSKMETQENLQILRDALLAIFNVQLGVRCVVVSSKTGQQPADLDVDGDGMVGTALDLGGKIVFEE
jgi:DNA polymerase-3 subunit gamma/tau